MCRNPLTTPRPNHPRTTVQPSSADVGDVSAPSGHNNNTLLFPWKLHEMLVAAERAGQDSIVSWLPDGKSFKVHNSAEFVKTVMPKHFKQTKYKSFQRQLNLWGFKRITRSVGPEKGAYSHPNFLKGQKHLCRRLCRQNGNVGGSSDSSCKSSKAKEALQSNAPTPTFEIQAQSPVPSLKKEMSIPPSMDVFAPTSLLSNPDDDSTHVSLLGLAMPAMTSSLESDQTLFQDLMDDITVPDSQPSPIQHVEAPSMPEMEDVALFEGCQFFLLDEAVTPPPAPEQVVHTPAAPAAMAFETVVNATPDLLDSKSASVFGVMDPTVITPPSSPRYEEADEFGTSICRDIDPLMSMPLQPYAV